MIKSLGFITKFMNNDHAYLHDLWVEFSNEKQNPIHLKKLFRKYKRHLLLHIKLEDKFLFPRLNKYLGIDKKSSLTNIIDQDHRKIEKLLALTEKAVLSGDLIKITTTGSHLDCALKKHQEREAEIQYPVSDAFVGQDEWEQMLDKVYGKILAK